MAPHVDKTFTDPDGDKLAVRTLALRRADGVEALGIYAETDDGEEGVAVHVRKADAPAAALAILEAAEYADNGPGVGTGATRMVAVAIHNLRAAAAEIAEQAAEADAEAKLDAEAEALYKAVTMPSNKLAETSDITRDFYRRLAHAAREIHAKKETN
jgi:hypothetical protein